MITSRIAEPTGPGNLLGAGYPGEELLDHAGDLRIGLRYHPDRRALIHRQVLCVLGQLGDELNGGGAGADQADPVAGGSIAVVPLGGVDDLARERLDAFDIGHLRLREVSGGREQVLAGDGVAGFGGDHPVLMFLIPAGARHRGVETHVLAQVVLVGHVAGVLLQLRARREQPGPVGVGLKRVRVRCRRDVDRQAGVVVDVPRTAKIILAIQDRQIGQAQLLELDCRPHAAETGPDDDGIKLRCHVPMLAAVPAKWSACLDTSYLGPRQQGCCAHHVAWNRRATASDL